MSTNIKEITNSPRLIDYLPADVDPAIKTTVGFLQAVVDAAMPSLVKKNITGNKDISEFYPFFKDHFVDLKPFSKVELLSKCGIVVEPENINQLKLSDIDRYMLYRMQYQVNIDKIHVECDEGGIPNALKGNDRVLAKSILRRSLTAEESGVMSAISAECADILHKYNQLNIQVAMLKENKLPSDKESFYNQIIEARKTGWFVDMPDPDAEETKHTEILKKKEEERSEKITLKDIEGFVDAGIDNAAFDFRKVVDVLKGVSCASSTKGLIINGIIEMIGGVVKTFVVSNSDKVRESFNEYPKISIDKSVEKIEGLADLLKEIIVRMDNMKNAGVDGQAKTIDDIVGLIKDNKEIFESEAFINIIEKALAKHEAKKNKGKSDKHEKKVEKLNEAEAEAEEQTSVENAAMAMSANEAFPQLHKDEQDSDKPSFLDGLVAMIKPAKEKPGFIQETNAVPVKETAQAPVVDVPMAINADVLRDYPWIQRIIECARKRAISLRIDPVMNIAPNTVGAITVLAYKDNQPIPSKSFTIDLGHCLDTRIKVFANCKTSGFAYMETCTEAYKIFTDNGKDVLVEFFDKLFLFGFDGFNDEESKKYRMYNSNTMQLNRIIHFNSLPTGQVEKGEKRQALKDSAFKMMTQLKEIARINGIEVGRFIVTDFDRNSMSYVLDNGGSMYNGRLINAPHMRIRVAIKMDGDKVVRDEHKRPCLSYNIEFTDNVVENFKYPDGSVLIVNAENQEENIQQTEPVEVIEGEIVEDVKPSFVQ